MSCAPPTSCRPNRAARGGGASVGRGDAPTRLLTDGTEADRLAAASYARALRLPSWADAAQAIAGVVAAAGRSGTGGRGGMVAAGRTGAAVGPAEACAEGARR